MLGWSVKFKHGKDVTLVNIFRNISISLSKLVTLYAVIALTSGCVNGLTQMQDSLSKFDEGAHSIATSQMAYFNGVHTVECERQFYVAASTYSMAKKADYKSIPINLRVKCEEDKLSLKSTQIKIRQKLLDAITLYADQLQALASAGADDNKNLDANLQTIATTLNTEASKHNLSKTDASIATGVEAAIVGLTNIVMDKVRASEIKKAAESEQDNLVTVVNALKTENTDTAYVADCDIDNIQTHLTEVLSDIRDKQGSAVFFDVVKARSYLQTVNPCGSKGLDSSDSLTASKQLNAALDSLLAANNAIATTGTGGIVAVVNDLVARAKAAEAIQAALSK
jgi:hypothetical protein